MSGLDSSHPGSGAEASQEAAADWHGDSGSDASEGGGDSPLPLSFHLHAGNQSWQLNIFGVFSSEAFKWAT